MGLRGHGRATHLSGAAVGEPRHAGYPLADKVVGLFGALGMMAALWKRTRDPAASGEEIDLSPVEATFKLLEFLPIEYQQHGVVRERAARSRPGVVLPFVQFGALSRRQVRPLRSGRETPT